MVRMDDALQPSGLKDRFHLSYFEKRQPHRMAASEKRIRQPQWPSWVIQTNSQLKTGRSSEFNIGDLADGRQSTNLTRSCPSRTAGSEQVIGLVADGLHALVLAGCQN
jgi:hypothetical protein